MSDRRLALVVAVDRYDDPALHQLAGPSADADALAEVLGDPALGGFEVDVLHNATSWATGQAVETLLAERHPTDLVLLHFSCHGLKDAAGELHLAATNTRPGLLGSTAVDAAWVNRLMQRSRAQRVVLLLDCCYGGAFERGVVHRAAGDIDVGDQFGQRQLGEGRGRVVITASTAMEFAFEGARLAGGPAAPSVFTGALVEGIRTGEADRDQDGKVALDELYDFVYDRVRDVTPNQTPSRWAFGVQGDFYVARNPRLRVQPVTAAAEPAAPARLAAVRELAPIARGRDLERAATAFIALREMAGDDSRMVSVAATAALNETKLRLATNDVDLGEVAVGSPAAEREVQVLGCPLALASAVHAPAPLEARLIGSTLQVSWAPAEAGNLSATVTLTGPAGDARLRVTGSATRRMPSSPPPSPPFAGRAGGGRRLRLLVALAIVAVLATGSLIILIGQYDGSAELDQPFSTALPPTREYATLLEMIPASVRATCNEGEASVTGSAEADCLGSRFELWLSKSSMDDHVRSIASEPGNCLDAPTTVNEVTALPATGRAGWLTCGVDRRETASEAVYFVEWSVNDLLLTGRAVSEPGRPATQYPQIYDRAIALLRETA